MEFIPQLGMLGYTDVLLIILVVLILFGIKKWPELFGDMGKSAEEIKRHSENLDREIRQYVEDILQEMTEKGKRSKPGSAVSRWFVVWLAQGFGIGRIPWAPGTFGSVLGLAWFAVLLLIAQWSALAAGITLVASIFAAVPTCEAAEIILGKKDPGSVVLDEIVALPTCFLGWIFHVWLQIKMAPSLDLFFGPKTWFLAFGVFLAFRFFDVVKPWPVRQSQELPRGWGVVVDDQLAAVYVNVTVLTIQLVLQILR